MSVTTHKQNCDNTSLKKLYGVSYQDFHTVKHWTGSP